MNKAKEFLKLLEQKYSFIIFRALDGKVTSSIINFLRTWTLKGLGEFGIAVEGNIVRVYFPDTVDIDDIGELPSRVEIYSAE